MADDTKLVEMIGQLGEDMSSIKEKVQNLGADFVAKTEAGSKVSEELKAQTDKALAELGQATSRISELEKRVASEREITEAAERGLGDVLVHSDKFKATDVSGGWRGSIRASAERADITSANTSVGTGRSAGTSLVAGARVPGIIGLPDRALTIRDLLAQGETASNSVEYVRETGFTNNAAPVAEGATKPKSDLVFNLETAPVRTIAHIFKASRQILDDAPGLASYINARGIYGLRFKEEQQILSGDGTGQNLEGLLTAATAYSAAFTPTSETPIDRIRLAILQVVLAEYPATGIVLNPTDWAKIEMVKDANGNYIVGNAVNSVQRRLWGLPVVETQAIAANEFLVGAFNLAAQIFDRMDVEVLLSTENVDDFERNMATIRVEERLALAIYRPDSLVTGELTTVTP